MNKLCVYFVYIYIFKNKELRSFELLIFLYEIFGLVTPLIASAIDHCNYRLLFIPRNYVTHSTIQIAVTSLLAACIPLVIIVIWGS